MSELARRPRVLAYGWYGAPNLGDEILLKSIVDWCANLHIDLTAISIDPQATHHQYGINTVDAANFGEVASVLLRSDLFLMGGGGIFQEYHSFNLSALFETELPGISAHARYFYLAKQFNVTTALIGQGVGPLHTADAKNVVRHIFSSADYISVRDHASSELLKHLGVSRDIPVAPDPAWALMPSLLSTKPRKLLDHSGRKVLGLIIREWTFDKHWDRNLVEALRKVLTPDWLCVWIPFQVDKSSVVTSDLPTITDLQEATGHIAPSICMVPECAQDLIDLLRCCDAVLSMRLHGSISALACGSRLAAIEYDDKMAAVHHAAGMPDDLRINIQSGIYDLEPVLTKLLRLDEPLWSMPAEKLDEFSTAAGLHFEIVNEATIQGASASNTNSCNSLDWLGNWVDSLRRRNRTLELKLAQATGFLQERDRLEWEKEREFAAMKSELDLQNQEIIDAHRRHQTEMERTHADNQRKTDELKNALAALEVSRQGFERYRNSKETDIQTLKNRIVELERLPHQKKKTLFSRLRRSLEKRVQLGNVANDAGNRTPTQERDFGGLFPRNEAFGWRRGAVQKCELVFLTGKQFEQSAWNFDAALALHAALAGFPVLYLVDAQCDFEGPVATFANIPHFYQYSLTTNPMTEMLSFLSREALIFACSCSDQIDAFVALSKAAGMRSVDVLGSGQDAVTSVQRRDETKLPDRFKARNVHRVEVACDCHEYDCYANVEMPKLLRAGSGRKAVCYALDSKDIDVAFLADVAAKTPGIDYFILHPDIEQGASPGNIHFVNVREAAVSAFMLYSDFVVLPFRPECSFEHRLQGAYSAAFMRKNSISSVECGEIPGLSIGKSATEFALLCNKNRGNEETEFENFISENNWFKRLESILPGRQTRSVDVVILIHNNRSIIDRCLRSLLIHCKDYIAEVIIVDNASNDGGPEYVERNFPEVKVIRNAVNGCSAGRNLGVSQGKAEYIAFFDSDQWFTGSFGFSEALSILTADSSVGAIGWNAGWFDRNRHDLGGLISDYCPNRAMNSVALARGYRTDIGFLGTSGLFMKRSTFDCTAGFDTNFDPTCFEDTDLCFQIKALGFKLAFRNLSGIRHQPHQTTNANSNDEKYKQLFLRNSNYFREKWKNHGEFFVDYV